MKILKRKYPEAAGALEDRAKVYNKSLKEILELEKKNKVIIVAPCDTSNLKTLTQDHKELEKLYEMGREDAKNLLTKENINRL